MAVGRVCNRDVVIIREEESLRDAARLMRARHVGALVVVGEAAGSRVPIGIVTDRDIVLALLRRESDLENLTVAEAMSREPLKLIETEDVSDAIDRMRTRAVRRAPVVDVAGSLIGIVSIDDLLDVLVDQLAALVRLIRRQPDREDLRR
ncbi:MAG TPA: CBS domain-containing protein [Gammaproteobacteria bacterium]|nr:CBS domain-containing protein [Gammaproteobacteria bacterium]